MAREISKRTLPGGKRVGLLVAAAAPALALVLGLVVLKVWRGSLSIPYEYSSSDANYQLMLVKGVLEQGWWHTNPDLGAPFAQQLYDFGVGADNLHILLIRALGLFSSDAGVVSNLFYILSFPLCAMTAYWVMRWAGITALPAVACSVLFALVPYHFIRGEHHAFLSAYYAIPPGAYLALAVLGGRQLFARRDSRRRLLRPMARRTTITVAACVAVASTGTVYYPAYVVLLVLVGLGIRLALERQRGVLVDGAVVLCLIGVVLAINLAPSMIYAAAHGRDTIVAQREPRESEVFALKLAQLVLPPATHRNGRLARVGRHYAETSPGGDNESYDATLGVFGTVGLLWLLAIALMGSVAPARAGPGRGLVGETATLTVASLLIGTIGGIGSLIAYLVHPQLRAWNRISILIAFFALLAFAYLLDRLGERFGASMRRQLAFAGLLGALLILGALDQTTPAFAPSYDVVAARYHNDERFVRAIEATLPAGASVFQAPYVEFPEGPSVHDVHDYDMLVGYLHSRHLRWSFGAMKGRAADWAAATRPLRPVELLPAVAAAGFDGFYVDRDGYTKHAQLLEATARALLGTTPISDGSHRRVFFDMRAYRGELARRHTTAELDELRAATLTPTTFDPVAGVTPRPELSRAGENSFRMTARQARIALVNPGRQPRAVLFVATLRADGAARATTTVRYPGGAVQAVEATSRGVTVWQRLMVAPGRNPISIATSGPATRRGSYVSIGNPRIVSGWLIGVELACLTAQRPEPGCG